MGKEEEFATAAAAAGVAKSAPPVVVSGMTLAGYSLNDWVLAATLMWIAVQMGGIHQIEGGVSHIASRTEYELVAYSNLVDPVVEHQTPRP